MAAKTFSGAVTNQSIEPNLDIVLKEILLTPAAAVSTATITDAVGVQVVLQAPANGQSVSYPNAANPTWRVPLQAPVTITTTGAGSFTRVDF